MANRNQQIKMILPIAIMAHNEELLIQRAIDSALNQYVPVGYETEVIVVANGCTDNTEDIVKRIAKMHVGKVVLLSLRDKGKTKALNSLIKYIDERNKDVFIPYVVLLDADCVFLTLDSLTQYVNKFKENEKLCAVAANCIPNVVDKDRRDVVSEMYRAILILSEKLEDNSISGGGYCIKSNVLNSIEFPEIQFAEDMYVSLRLDGWFARENNIKIAYEISSNLQNEIKRKIRQEISTKRYFMYLEHMRKMNKKTCLYDTPLAEQYRWGGYSKKELMHVWWNLNTVKQRLLVALYMLIRLYAKLHTVRIQTLNIAGIEDDYWEMNR